jgi:hypothetical protein
MLLLWLCGRLPPRGKVGIMASFRLCYFPGGVKDVRIGHRGTSGVRRDLTPKIWRESSSPECLISESSSLKCSFLMSFEGVQQDAEKHNVSLRHAASLRDKATANVQKNKAESVTKTALISFFVFLRRNQYESFCHWHFALVLLFS